MRKKVSLAMGTGIVVVALSVSTAFAWTYGLTGYGSCQQNGSYKITWTVNNSTEKEALKITSSSNPAIVAVGAQIAAKSSQSFNQTVDGTKPGNYSLNLSGHWKSDKTDRNRSSTVKLDKACTQPEVPPVTPPSGGMGGGSVDPTPTPTPASQAAAPQVEAPVGAVNAGSGTRILSMSAVLGLVASIAALGYGVRRLVYVSNK